MLAKQAVVRAPLVWLGGQLMRLGEKTVTPTGKALESIGRVLRRGGGTLVTAGKVATRRYAPLAIRSARAAAPKKGRGVGLIAGRLEEILRARRAARLVGGGTLGALGIPAAAIGLQKKEGAMLTKATAEAMGQKFAADIVLQPRREKLARAVVTLVKKATLAKQAGLGAAVGTAAKSIPWGQVFKKVMPYLGAAGIGAGATHLLGRRQQPQGGMGSMGGAGGGWFGGGKQKPLWSPSNKRMFGRMGIDPTEEAGRTRAMRDVGAGGAWRAQAHKERMNLIRGMYNI